jgi:hypothetical protein
MTKLNNIKLYYFKLEASHIQIKKEKHIKPVTPDNIKTA